MTAEEVGAAANWVLAIMSLLGVVWVSAVRITSLQVKVDTVVAFDETRFIRGAYSGRRDPQ